MTVIVESKRLKVTRALRNFVTEQAERLTKLGADITQIRVYLETVRKKSNDPTANIATYVVSIPGKKAMVVKKKAVDMYQAISDGSKEALRRLRKVREKRMDLQRKKPKLSLAKLK